MFEFSKKELRKEFIETKYGKKANTYLCVSFVVSLISFIACLVVSDIVKNDLVILILDIIFGFCAAAVCYFDGKRDGAFEQFKASKK